MNRHITAVGLSLTVALGVVAAIPAVAAGNGTGVITIEGPLDDGFMFRAKKLKDCLPKGRLPSVKEDSPPVPVGGVELYTKDGFEGRSMVFCFAGEPKTTNEGNTNPCCTQVGDGAFRFAKGHRLDRNIESMRILKYRRCDSASIGIQRPKKKSGFSLEWSRTFGTGVFFGNRGIHDPQRLQRWLKEKVYTNRKFMRVEIPERYDDVRIKALHWDFTCDEGSNT